jgi:hypothetical protein
MSTSAFGIDHGYQVSKAGSSKDAYDAGRQRRFITNMAIGGAGGAAAGNIGAKVATRGRSRLRPGRAALAGGALMGGVGVGIVSRERHKGNIHKADEAQGYRRKKNTMNAIGGGSAAMGATAGGIGLAEHKGKDPMGYTRTWAAETGRKVTPRMRSQVLGSVARGHRQQAIAAGALGAGALALGHGYKKREQTAIGKALSQKTKDRGQRAGSAGVGTAAVGAGGYNAQFLGRHVASDQRKLRASHHLVALHNMGEVGMGAKDLAEQKAVRRITGRRIGIKGAGALASAGIAGAGGKAIYEAARKQG